MENFSKNQLERYPIYLKYFKELEKNNIQEISSPKIADKLGYSQEQVRKDLQAISGEPGKPKRGRSVAQLISDIETFLGYRDATTAIVIGTGHLGGALLNYPAFQSMGLEIVAGFDNDPEKVGTLVGGKMIFSIDRLGDLLPRLSAHIAIICVPAGAAQSVVEDAVKFGAKGIWNFAPTHVTVPDGVVLENVNLASSLAVLSHHLSVELSRKKK
ncbi:MAG: redox-sensing transcriptional repressor Rex [Bacilli bacterium]|nr:redox-sensing transcriptional repressor Rex [Bacilli bacterium]